MVVGGGGVREAGALREQIPVFIYFCFFTINLHNVQPRNSTFVENRQLLFPESPLSDMKNVLYEYCNLFFNNANGNALNRVRFHG